MFGIARNELRAYFRLLKQQPIQISIDSLPEFTFQMQSPEQDYQRKEAFLSVLRALTKLPDRDQEVIALRYGAGLPAGQIASIMELDENHVGVLLHRTVEKLKKSLEEVSYGIQ